MTERDILLIEALAPLKNQIGEHLNTLRTHDPVSRDNFCTHTLAQMVHELTQALDELRCIQNQE